jgi:hypothetical protein
MGTSHPSRSATRFFATEPARMFRAVGWRIIRTRRRAPTNILSIELGTFIYMFDFVSELEVAGVLEPGTVGEDRLVAGHGFSTAEVAGREMGRMRGCVGATENIWVPARIKATCSAGRSADASMAWKSICSRRPVPEPGMVRTRETVSQDGGVLRSSSRHVLLLQASLQRPPGLSGVGRVWRAAAGEKALGRRVPKLTCHDPVLTLGFHASNRRFGFDSILIALDILAFFLSIPA